MTATVPVGSGPASAGSLGVALNPTTNTLYVTNSNGTTVTAINGATNATTNVSVGSTQTAPYSIAVNPVTNTVYVGDVPTSTSTESNSVTVINGGTDATSTFAVEAAPDAIAVNSATNMVYVANSISKVVTVINGATNATTTIPAGNTPVNIAVNQVTNTVYVVNQGNGGSAGTLSSVMAINGATNAVTATISVGALPLPLAVNSVTNTIYVVNAGADSSGTYTVSVIDGATNAVTATVTVGLIPNSIAINTTTNTIYVVNGGITSNGAYTMSVIDGATNAVTATVTVGSQPDAVAVNTTTNTIYVANQGTNSVTVINGDTNAVTATIPVGTSPVAIAVDSSTNTAYVVNESSNDVTVISGSAASSAPVFTVQPTSQTISSGSTVVFNAKASGSPNYQWMLNGVALSNGSGVSGATGSTLVIDGATSANAGSYSCVVSNSAGTITSNTATLTAVTTSDPGRLINISARAQVGTGANILIAGFVVGGAGTTGDESLLIRGSGPALIPYGVMGTLPDPQLQLYSGSAVLATNNGWLGNAQISSTASAVGAAPWSNPSSHDSALLESMDGGYTAQIAGQSGDTGVALAEVYDATPSGTYTLTTPRLINISARVQVGTGGNILIAGFVIGGSTSRSVLIRASGPALIPYGVMGTLSDPELQLYSGSTLLGSNTGWGGETEIVNAATSVGAATWTNPSSNDSALLVTLPPGAYTAQVSGASGDTGVALVEVYEVP